MSVKPLPQQALKEAADWLMRMHAGNMTEEEKTHFEDWRTSSDECAKAWDKAERLIAKFDSCPASLASSTYQRFNQRRHQLKKLFVWALSIPAGWGVWKLSKDNIIFHLADYQSATGEIRRITLSDQTHISLNTHTAIDVIFNDKQRLIRLYQGEILIRTGRDVQHRPFIVQTDYAALEALGTYFNVRHDSAQTVLTVHENAVRIIPVNASVQSTVIHSGETVTITSDQISPVTTADKNTYMWDKEFILVNNWPLHQVIATLNTYYKGVISCTDDVKDIPISGSFPVTNIHQALSMLSTTYSLKKVTRFNQYWITLTSANQKN